MKWLMRTASEVSLRRANFSECVELDGGKRFLAVSDCWKRAQALMEKGRKRRGAKLGSWQSR
jgi:hypothetical protein